MTFSQNGDFSVTAGNENDEDLRKVWTDKIKALQLDRDHHVVVQDLDKFMNLLFETFPIIEAAGGYVLNTQGKLLMIFRKEFWDLPKGKLDEGESLEETAKREVEEECGIGKLHIISEPFSTYHVYEERGRVVIKHSVWYAMKTSDTQQPVPQEEEEITDARWVELPVSDSILEGAYASIREVITHFSG